MFRYVSLKYNIDYINLKPTRDCGRSYKIYIIYYKYIYTKYLFYINFIFDIKTILDIKFELFVIYLVLHTCKDKIIYQPA